MTYYLSIYMFVLVVVDCVYKYRSSIAGSFKNNSKNKKRKIYEIMKTKNKNKIK